MSIGRRAAALCAAVALMVTAVACTDSQQAAGPDGVHAGVAEPSDSAPSTPVTLAPIESGVEVPSSTVDEPTAPPVTSSSAPPAPLASVTSQPAFDSVDISPGEPIVLTAADGTFAEVTFSTPEGTVVDGEVSEDGTQWTLGEKLGFGKTYTVTGLLANVDGVHHRFTGEYTTAETIEPVTVSISPRDGAEVGVATPIIVSFGFRPEDLKLIEENVSVTTEPHVEGSWAWIQHIGYSYPTLDWRPKEYWPANTKVHVEANLYGLKFADRWYGGADVSVDFTIGRNQVVYADASKNLMQVFRDGELVAEYPASFGRGDEVNDPKLVTRSGIHVVTSWHEIYKMSNPEYGYTDAKEYWAVRINSNGEFIHHNPSTTQWQLENVNKTHGCINLSWDDAKEYFDSVLYGDPVEVLGTSIQLSQADGDLYDWTIEWEDWLSRSALAENSTVVGND